MDEAWLRQRDRELRQWSDKRDREMREFLDALTERHIGVTQQMIGAMNAGFDQLGSALAELQAEIADQREQIRANTRALLRVLDRLGPA
jgi:peptidoglycan hydrolase CwlO-like protein